MNNSNQWQYPIGSGAGYLLPGGALPAQSGREVVPDQNTVRLQEPRGTVAPTKRIGRGTGFEQLANLSSNFTMEKLQGAFRAAEAGDTRILFTYYRDFLLGNSIVYSALSKRKMATMSEQWKIVPASKNKDDIKAAETIDYCLRHSNGFNNSLIHLMNAIVYPIAMVEKIFYPADENKYELKYQLKSMYPIDYNLISYKVAYVPQVMTSTFGTSNVAQMNPALVNSQTQYSPQGAPGDYQYNPDAWEPDIRLWPVLPNGVVIQTPALMIQPDPNRMLVYRSNLMNGIARENFGGLGKSLLFLTVMSQVGLNIFLQCMQKYGLPFVKIQADESQIDTVNKIIETFGDMSSALNAIAVNKDAQVELVQMNYGNAAEGHEKFLNYIKDCINMLINGETLSSNKSTGGLGNGKDSIQGDVREDIKRFDRLMLNETLQTQLFKYILEWNNIPGEVPSIVWGGGYSTGEKVSMSTVLLNLKNGGFGISDESLEDMSNDFGFQLEKFGDDSEDSEESDDQNDKNNETEESKSEEPVVVGDLEEGLDEDTNNTE